LPPAPFRDTPDPDEKRKEILWIAISFIVILATWLAVVMLFGYRPLSMGLTYDEAVLAIGVGVLLLCAVLYLAAREREQRHTNQFLLKRLGTTIADLDERVRHLNGLCTTSAQLMGSLDSTHICRLVVDSLAEIMAAAASLIFVDEQTGIPVWAMRHPSSHASHDDRQAPASDIAWPVPTSSSDGRVKHLEAQIEVWNQLGYVIAAPVAVRKGLQGVLLARRNPSDPPFTPGHLNALITFANMASKGFESSDLYRELKESYLATVRSLIYSLDARDNYAAAHGHRVAEVAVRIAEQMGLPDDVVRDLEVFAPLHDVGKIGIPDSILLKTGPLTSEEREACKAHAVIGERIVRPLKPGPGALSLIRNHHESWDGSGYPDGLQRDQIPILARVVQVADCYDALASDRPYRPVMSQDEVLAHFRVNAGAKYDPAVVGALLAVLHHEPLPPAPVRSPVPASDRAVSQIGAATSDQGLPVFVEDIY